MASSSLPKLDIALSITEKQQQTLQLVQSLYQLATACGRYLVGKRNLCMVNIIH
jgi:hypothetical protein